MKQLFFLLVLLAGFAWGCNKTEYLEKPTPSLDELTADDLEVSDLSDWHNTIANEDCAWITVQLPNETLAVQLTSDSAVLLEGDILHESLVDFVAIHSQPHFHEGETQSRGASRAGVYLWPQRRVYYTFAPGFPSTLRNSFLAACQKWNQYTGIQFILRTNQPNYIRVFKDGNNNYSWLGMRGGMQNLSLADANIGVAIHELGHALGLIHEHQRSDRNTFIWVNPAVANQSNYLRYSNSYNYTAFDWNSIMLYASSPYGNSYTMLRRPNYTIFTNTIEYRRKLGSYALPSSRDIAAINYMYGG